MNTIKEGDFVVLRGSDNGRLVQVDRKKPVFFGKKKINIHAAIGESFGSVFELCNMNLCKITAAEYKKRCSECEVPGGDAQTTGQDNRNLVDNNNSQRLTREDIETFKADGTSGETIVRTLVENSATFRDKTEYSQRKYLHKKQKKYQPHLTLERPTARLLAEVYYSQSPLKIGNMRVDSLAQMLTCCNVRSGGRYMVFDSWLGLLTAAVLERLGQDGSVVQVYAGHGPSSSYRQAVNALNLPEELLHSTLLELPYARACALLAGSASSETPAEDAPKGDPSSEVEMTEASEDSLLANNSGTKAAKQQLESNDKSTAATDPKDAERAARKQRRMQEQERALGLLRTRSLDGLLVASKHHPTAIVLSLLEFVAPSRPFAVFCSYREPLVDCYAQLKDAGSAVFLKISESWLRSYQVLPDRTHPAINMSGGGGYVLTGIKVAG
ncbi:tRNA (adenine(58)-N(1))-methyltransferase non-catalytic subunit TRM6-like [Haemaphysalis longicornis]